MIIIDEVDQVIMNNPISFDDCGLLNGLFKVTFAKKVFCFFATCGIPPKMIMNNEFGCKETVYKTIFQYIKEGQEAY